MPPFRTTTKYGMVVFSKCPIFLSVPPLVFFTTHGVEEKYFSIYGKRRLYIVIPLN